MAAGTLNPASFCNKPFYVYLYRDPRPNKNNLPIYVGKGTASLGRAYVHWNKRTNNPMLAYILSKIRGDGLTPVIEIVSFFDDEAEAFALEIELIKKFGRRDLKSGSLANLTNGGDGTSGFVPSAHHRSVTSARMKTIRAVQWEDREFRTTALRNLAVGRSSPEARLKAAVGVRKAKAELSADPDRVAKQSAQRSMLRRAAWKNPEIRERYVSANRACKETKRDAMNAHYANAPEVVEAKRAWMTRALDDPDFRAKIAAGTAKSKRDPEKSKMWAEAKAALAASVKASWADPVRRAARLASMKAMREKKAAALAALVAP